MKIFFALREVAAVHDFRTGVAEYVAMEVVYTWLAATTATPYLRPFFMILECLRSMWW
jgi:hypothetical protein